MNRQVGLYGTLALLVSAYIGNCQDERWQQRELHLQACVQQGMIQQFHDDYPEAESSEPQPSEDLQLNLRRFLVYLYGQSPSSYQESPAWKETIQQATRARFRIERICQGNQNAF